VTVLVGFSPNRKTAFKIVAAACLAALAMAGPLRALDSTLTAPGLPQDVIDQIEGSSATLAAQDNDQTSPQEILAAALADYRTIVQVLYDAGYFSPQVSIRLDGREAANIPLINPPGQVARATITVNPGRQFRFGTARVAPVAPGMDLPPEFATGQVATTGTIRAAALGARDGWRNVGHAKASVGDQSITANHSAARVDADIRIIPGPQLRFGRLSVSGNTRMRTEAIQRIAGLPWDETYSPEMVQRVAARLRRTGVFSSVSIVEAETPNADGTLDFTANVAEQLPRRITFGAEIASNSGVTLSAAWLHRNLFGAGERFRLEGEIRNIGGDQDIDGRVAFRLDRPARLGRDNNLFYLGSIERIDRDHYDLNRAMLGVGVRRIFSDTLMAEASLEISTTRADDAFGTDRKFDLISLPFTAEWDRRDSETSATQGFYLNARLTPFAGISGSGSGLAAYADGRGYLSFGEDGRIVLAGRVQLGSVVGPSLSEISPDMLFFSGGAGTVRGQPYESLGIPVGANIAGGRSMLAATAEIRARVAQKITLVGFYDIGAIDSSSFVSGSSRRHAGAGIGIRYDLGAIGPIRLDLAKPVSGTTGDGLQFYLGIGQAF
jgi:translocation and assembly module TamA|tara:strand:- start:394 stop:2217 length:1824 start_codon:yes stop_codon:yes gene_type:complete